MTLNVGIYIYPEVEILDFAGPFEVFSTASRVRARKEPSSPDLFNVFTIGEHTGPVFARGGLQVTPAYDLSGHPGIDLLLIPGGVVLNELEKPHVIDWIAQKSCGARITASVCTGVFILAKAGLIGTRSVTTHWEDISDLRSMFPDIDVMEDTRWVDEGQIVTSAGISAGIDMSLHLVSRILGRQLAVQTAKQMEFDWHDQAEEI